MKAGAIHETAVFSDHRVCRRDVRFMLAKEPLGLLIGPALPV